MPDFSLTTREVADRLRTSDSSLRRLRREGVLKPGIHFRGQGLGTLRQYCFGTPRPLMPPWHSGAAGHSDEKAAAFLQRLKNTC